MQVGQWLDYDLQGNMQAGIDNLHITGVTQWLHAKRTQWHVLKAAYNSNRPAVKPGQTLRSVLQAAAAQHS
jgi:hypothetical protein